MATLAADISATTRTITLSGDVSAAVPGKLYAIDDEVILLEGYEPYGTPVGGDDHGSEDLNSAAWRVKRGQGGSTPATHSSGATVYGAITSVALGTGLVAPSPVGMPRNVAINVTAAEIAEGVTKAAIPALGAGKGPILVTADLLYLAGDVAFASSSAVAIKTDAGSTYVAADVGFAETSARLLAIATRNDDLVPTELVNLPLDLVVEAAGWRGAILTSEIDSAGSGYEVGDAITLEAPAGATAPVVTVATVDGGGAVLTYTVTEAGTASPVANIGQESTSGAGEGFALNVLTVSENSDGTGRLLVTYYEADLA